MWIFGSPRTGSSWLLRMLLHPWRLAANDVGLRPPSPVHRGDPPIVPVNESHLPMHLTPQKVPRYDPMTEARPEDFLANTKRVDNGHYFFSDVYADAWKPEVRRLMLTRFAAQAERAGASSGRREGPPIVVKEPNGSHGAQLVMELLPRAKLVFLTRDGRDVVDSQLALRVPGGARAKDGRQGGDPLSTYEKRLSEVLRNARLWVNRMKAVQAAYEAHAPELRYSVRYEDLRHHTLEHLLPLRRFLGLPSGDEDVRAAVDAEAFESVPERKKGFGTGKRAAQPGHWRKTLTPVEQRVAEQVMAEQLAELGYELYA